MERRGAGAERARREEVVRRLRELGVDGEGVYRATAARPDGQEPLAVCERQLAWYGLRHWPRPGRASGRILMAIAADWAAPEGVEEEMAAAVGASEASRRDAGVENAACYREGRPAVSREERPPSEEEWRRGRAGYELVRAYMELPRYWLRRPSVVGVGVRVVVPCPSEEWRSRTAELSDWLGRAPWWEGDLAGAVPEAHLGRLVAESSGGVLCGPGGGLRGRPGGL